MFRSISRVLAVTALAGVLGLSGCHSVKRLYAETLLPGRTLTYDEYLSQPTDAVPALTVDDVIRALGPPASAHDRDGRRRRIDYHAFTLAGELKRAEFHFDKDERLTKKELW